MTDTEKLKKLKEILLEEDREFADKIFKRVAEIETTLNEEEILSGKVNPIVDKKIETFSQEIPQKMGPAITKALKVQIRDSQDQVVEALFPIIGKMIKKYIQEEIKKLTENINNQVQDTFSFSKWRIKLKSIFTGVSEEKIILSEMSKPVVEQLFVVEKGSGLLIKSATKREDKIDEDMVAGMLTAIKSFVEDAFAKEGQNLELIQYELYNIYMQNFSKFYIAVVVSGAFNTEFKDKIEDIIFDTLSKNKKETVISDSKITDKLTKLLFEI